MAHTGKPKRLQLCVKTSRKRTIPFVRYSESTTHVGRNLVVSARILGVKQLFKALLTSVHRAALIGASVAKSASDVATGFARTIEPGELHGSSPVVAPTDSRSARTGVLAAWMRRLLLSADSEQLFHANVAAGVTSLVPGLTGLSVAIDDAGVGRIVGAAGIGADSVRGAQFTIPDVGPIRRSIDTRKAVRVVEPMALPPELRIAGLSVSIVAPVFENERCVSLFVAAGRQDTFGPRSEYVMNDLQRWIAVGIDNARMMARAEADKDRAEVTLHSIGDAVITTDENGTVEYLNPVAEALTGWTNIEAYALPVEDVFDVIDEATGVPVDNPVAECLITGARASKPRQAALVRRDGQVFAIDDSASPIHNESGRVTGTVLVFHDVSQSRALARQLSWQAQHDALTRLPNRRRFEEDLEHALKSARDRQQEHVVLYLDLDQFKLVNDTSGHLAGDELLKQLSELLQPKLRSMDTLARLGGDEFGVLLLGHSLEAGERAAEEIRATIRAFRFVWDGTAFEVGVSVGLVVIDANSGSLSDVMSAADIALYAAKDEGRNRVHIWRPGDATVARRTGQMDWATQLTMALQEDRFELMGQPIVPISDEASEKGPLAHHVEVLLRMRMRDGRLVSPGAFIPAAERYNMMYDVDRWVVRKALATMARINGPSALAINLSGASLSNEGLLPHIREQLRINGVAPERVTFEITETAAIQNLPRAMHLIGELQAIGCQFALDDFGSGLSSFAYMKSLPVDFIKIDGAFVREMTRDPVSRAIVEAAQSVAQTLGVATIAEFVEDNSIYEAVKACGVDYAQGYAVGPPIPLEKALRAEPYPKTRVLKLAR